MCDSWNDTGLPIDTVCSLQDLRLESKRLMVNKSLGETLLHRAARNNRVDVVKFCLESDVCDVNARDNAGYTPLHECSSRGNLEVARLLLEHSAEPNASATGGIRWVVVSHWPNSVLACFWCSPGDWHRDEHQLAARVAHLSWHSVAEFIMGPAFTIGLFTMPLRTTTLN